jgi:hypothetical protein
MPPFFTRLTFAFKTFFAVLFHGRIPDDVAITIGGATPREPVATHVSVPTPEKADLSAAGLPKAEPTAAQMLAVLQRDGRLVDFLMEDVAPFSDAQIGAAVRNVHAGCRDAVARYLTLEPVLASEEGARITIEPGTSAARVKVLGNVAGQPPFSGVVRHRGWMLNRTELPTLPANDPYVIAPAEVEVA